MTGSGHDPADGAQLIEQYAVAGLNASDSDLSQRTTPRPPAPRGRSRRPRSRLTLHRCARFPTSP